MIGRPAFGVRRDASCAIGIELANVALGVSAPVLLKLAVDEMSAGWDALLQGVPPESTAHSALLAQRDACFEALRVQSELFHAHRQVCVKALRLQAVSP